MDGRRSSEGRGARGAPGWSVPVVVGGGAVGPAVASGDVSSTSLRAQSWRSRSSVSAGSNFANLTRSHRLRKSASERFWTAESSGLDWSSSRNSSVVRSGAWYWKRSSRYVRSVSETAMQNGFGSWMTWSASRSRFRARTWGGMRISGAWRCRRRLSQNRTTSQAAVATATAKSVHPSQAQLLGISTGPLMSRMSSPTARLVAVGPEGGGTMRAPELVFIRVGGASRAFRRTGPARRRKVGRSAIESRQCARRGRCAAIPPVRAPGDRQRRSGGGRRPC